MPVISLFFGIRISMYWEDHAPPHFHAQYAEYEASIDINAGCVLKGFLPQRQLKYVLAWCHLHQDELMQDWELARISEPLVRIAPLQ